MQIFDNLIKLDGNNYGLLGLTDESFCAYIKEVFDNNDKSLIILTANSIEANNLLNSLIGYTNDVLFFPMDEFLTSMAFTSSPELMVTRLETLNSLLEQKKKIVICSLMGFLRFLPTKNLYLNSIIKVSKNCEYPIKDLVSKLIDIGYKRDTYVSKTGDIAVRGFVIDIFPIGSEHPIRLEYFGDEIDSIRVFDEETQLSIKEIDTFSIYPASDVLIKDRDASLEYKNYDMLDANGSVGSLIDYVGESSIVIKDYPQLKNIFKEIWQQMDEFNLEHDIEKHKRYMFNLSLIPDNGIIHYLTSDNLLQGVSYKEIKFNIKKPPKFHENIDEINKYLRDNLSKRVVLCLKKQQIKSFAKYIDAPYTITDFNSVSNKIINIVCFDINEGFIYKDLILLSDKELFSTKKTNKVYKTHFKYSSSIRNINKLEVGDAVVHSIHGIGIYNGIKTLESQGLKKDYLEILYKGNDKLYIPVEKISCISKFTGKEGIIPKINSLSGSDWQKTKMRITGKVREVAQELLKIYAEREYKQGFKFAPDDEMQLMFEEEFPYHLTTDQALAVKQIKEEMETSHPMDRLLCGDVGFGKTEVAFRAIFKAICNSKQVLYLCPTTILSMQIYNNAKERFKDFPVNIALLNRFTPPKETKRIIDGLKDKSIDFLIETDRLLSDDVAPVDLGLLVIDEEQRFGVTHKEKIKKYKANVDVLTLTATPIPRTLQMSLVGIRSLSLITTPPVNRYPIQTYVVEESKQLIKEAITKEISRGGQVYVLYNSVESIQNKVAEIQELVPDAKIIYAHGQMDKSLIESQMLKFIQNEAQVLVCTTIIETGIDIPNVNTLIILDADRFGLSQIYQIRGRVGRSDKIAYAYMMYRQGKVLTETALKRLKTIQEFTELGSGFKIASRDLSIRGAGNILGDEQSGFIDTIGVDLYLKILNEEVARLKGEQVVAEDDKQQALVNVETHIDSNYVSENEIKILIHQMINKIDSLSSLNKIRSEIEDRFGKINKEIEIYMYEEWFDKLAREVQIIKVNQTKTFIELIFSKDATKKMNYEKIFVEACKISRYFKFSYKNNCLIITLELPKLEKNYIYYLVDLVNVIKQS